MFVFERGVTTQWDDTMTCVTKFSAVDGWSGRSLRRTTTHLFVGLGRTVRQLRPVDAEGFIGISLSAVFGTLVRRGRAEPESAEFRRVWSRNGCKATCVSVYH